jgi:hypothetical protein
MGPERGVGVTGGMGMKAHLALCKNCERAAAAGKEHLNPVPPTRTVSVWF